MYGFESLGLIMGALVIVFALHMRSKPADRKTYGVLILVFSLVSFIGMGGFLIGAILGFVGGVLAIA
jgi:bacteriorhodopsin